MPTGGTFRLAAGRFDELATDVAALARSVDTADVADGLAGRSRVRTLVNDALATGNGSADDIVSACEQLATEARRRADECDAYEEALAAYHTSYRTWSSRREDWRLSQLASEDDDRPRVPWPGSAPTRPEAPSFYSSGAPTNPGMR